MPVIAIAKEDNVFSSAEFSIGEKRGVQKRGTKRSPDHKCVFFGGGGLGMMCDAVYLFHWYHVMCTCNEQQHYHSRSRVCSIIYPMCI
jgi:hypothetical protein